MTNNYVVAKLVQLVGMLSRQTRAERCAPNSDRKLMTKTIMEGKIAPEPVRRSLIQDNYH